MSDDSKTLSRVEDILSSEDYIPTKPMSRIEKLLLEGGGPGGKLPEVTSDDNGKILKVKDGAWDKGEDISGDKLPQVSSQDNGKVLKVVSGEWNIGDDKSESSFVYISSSYPFSGSKVALPANINSVLIANYYSSPKVPTFLVTSNNIIFEPKEVNISAGITPSVHIRWGRMYSEFDSATREKNIYNDSLSYNTQNQTTEASYYKTKAIPTIPTVDSSDNYKVMQVSGGEWVANFLPTVDGVPPVEQADVGKVLKATDVGEYDWGDASRTNAVQVPPVIYDNGELKKISSVDNFPGLEKIYTTPTKYAALSDDEKNDLSKIYYVSDYEFYSDPDNPVVVRAGANNDIKWFFNGYTFAKGARYEVPENLRQFQPGGTGKVRCDSNPYATATDTTPISSNYFVGWHYYDDSNKIRYSSITSTSISILNGTVYAVIDPNGGAGQSNPYTDPYDVPNGFIIYYGNKQYTDFDIPDPLPSVTSSDNGKVLKVVSGAWSKANDEGGSEAVYKTHAEYQALTQAQKEDPTKIYFVINEGTKISPTLSADDGNVSASSSQGGTSAPWKVLDGTSMEKGVKPHGHIWQPWGQNGGEWWQYNFANGNKFSKISFKIASSSTQSNTMGFKVEASNDGETWTPITYGTSDYIDYYLPGYDTSVSNGFNWVDVTLILDCPINYSKIRLYMDKSVGYPYSNNGVMVNDVQIYAAAASNKSSIYYKNVLYTPDELPVTTISDAGKVLKVNEDGLWDKGNIPSSCTPIEIEAEDYHALSQSEKVDPTKIYFVKAGTVITDTTSVIPRNPQSSNIDCNTGSASYNSSAAYAFDGIMNTPPDGRASYADSVTAWYPGYGNAPESAWASYHFDSVITNLVKLEVYAYNMSTSNPSAVFTTLVIVEGSIDGTAWFNILANGASSFTLNTKETEFVKNEIFLDNSASVSYIRIRFLNQINGYNDTNFAIAEIYAYTGNAVVYDNSTYYMGVKHGKTIQELPELVAADEGKILKVVNGKWDKGDAYVELTQSEYDALPSSKESDGIIYFING